MGEVAALVEDAGKFCRAIRAVFFARVAALGFLAHVELLEGEDREAVDDHARGFGIFRHAGFGRLEVGDEHFVHFLDEVVALLVVMVDRAFCLTNPLRAEVVAAGDVFLVPEHEVKIMVFSQQQIEAFAFRAGVELVPEGGEARLQTGDFLGVVFHARGGLAGHLRLQAGVRQASLLTVTTRSVSHAPKSLLVIKPSSLGDIVHALQVLQPVARKFPECKITWVARDRFAPLVEAAPFIDEVIHFNRKEGLRGIWNVMKRLRAQHFDVVWDMQGLLRSGLMAAAARSPMKWGRHDSREGAGLFTRRVEMPAGAGPHHAIAILQKFARTLGLDEEAAVPLELKPPAEFAWRPFFDGERERRFVIFTDSRGAEKEWGGFSELTRLIFENIPDSRVAWCAGARTAPKFEVSAGRFLNLSGCPFDEMLALARQPSVFIGNDSGPMHLSAASGNLVLAIFGPTPPEKFGPWPIGSSRTASVRAPGGDLKALSAEEVFGCLERLLGKW